jgi:hypothetical protein
VLKDNHNSESNYDTKYVANETRDKVRSTDIGDVFALAKIIC